MSARSLLCLSLGATLLFVAVWSLVHSSELPRGQRGKQLKSADDSSSVVANRVPATEATREPLRVIDGPVDLVAGPRESGEAAKVDPDPATDFSAMSLEALQVALAEAWAAFDHEQGPAVEDRMAEGLYNAFFAENPVSLKEYANADLPTTVELATVAGTNLSEVKVVTLPREEYPEICALYDRYRELQNEVWTRQREARNSPR